MTKFERITTAIEQISENWNREVVVACFESAPFKGTFDEFLKNCTPCGGNWGGLLLSGINKLYPEVYDAIPDNMGVNAFGLLIHTLILLGVDFPEDE